MPRLAILPCLFLACCQGTDPQRVAADRATYDWFAPMTRGYIQADPRLDEAAKATHLRGLDAWNDRIKADEAAVGLVMPAPTVAVGGAK